MPAAAKPALGHHSSCTPSRARRCVRIFLAHLFSNLGLFALVVGYVLLGALLFEFLESGYELEQRGHIQRFREDCLKELWGITERLNVLYEKNWTRLVHEQLRKFETSVVAATKVDGYDGKTLRDAERQWSFSGALLYSVTVITTIGYGNLAPKTPEGKLVTMLYALVGVPLMLLCLSNLGSLLADTFQFAYSHACCMAQCGRPPPPPQQHHRPRSTSTAAPQQPPHHHTAASSTGDHLASIVPARSARLHSRTRGRPRPLTPEVRKLLTECAEYSLANDNGGGDPSAARLLRELHETPLMRDGDIKETQDEDDEEEEEEDEEEGEDDGDELEDVEHEQSGITHNTPSRVPLIWHHSHHHKRPPTPPPRREYPPTETEFSGPPESPPLPAEEENIKVPVSIVLLVLMGYICLGATVFATWEDWSFLDGAYFCFITLSTIGFGDLVPGKSFQRADTQGGQLQLVACCAYLLLGLVLIAMSFSLVQEEVLAKCRQVALRIGILKRVDVEMR